MRRAFCIRVAYFGYRIASTPEVEVSTRVATLRTFARDRRHKAGNKLLSIKATIVRFRYDLNISNKFKRSLMVVL